MKVFILKVFHLLTILRLTDHLRPFSKIIFSISVFNITCLSQFLISFAQNVIEPRAFTPQCIDFILELVDGFLLSEHIVPQHLFLFVALHQSLVGMIWVAQRNARRSSARWKSKLVDLCVNEGRRNNAWICDNQVHQSTLSRPQLR